MRFAGYSKRDRGDVDSRETARKITAIAMTDYAALQAGSDYYGRTDRYSRFYAQIIDATLDLPVEAFRKPMVEFGASALPFFLESDVVDLAQIAKGRRTVVHDLDTHPWPIPDRKYGVAVISHCLEHLKDKPAALAELWRVADYAVVALPLSWKHDPTHKDIDPGVLHGWVGGLPMVPLLVVPSYGCTRYEQFVAVYRNDGKQGDRK